MSPRVDKKKFTEKFHTELEQTTKYKLSTVIHDDFNIDVLRNIQLVRNQRSTKSSNRFEFLESKSARFNERSSSFISLSTIYVTQ